MKKISIVIPVYNEEVFINGLLESIEKVNYPKDHYETIVVSDGSTDATSDIVKGHPDVQLIALAENVGRYKCRERGARTARFPNILFVDSRAVVDPDILYALDRIGSKVIIGQVNGVDKPGSFETFYRAVRILVFNRFFKIRNQPLLITPENFETMPKGTTVLFLEKEVLFRAYEKLANVDMGKLASDDIKMLRTIVDEEPLLIHPAVKITHFSRTSFQASIKHLVWRGTNFVDYYLHPSKRNFWLVIFFPLLAALTIVLALISIPMSLIAKALFILGLDLVFSLILARSVRDFLIIIYMLPLCAAVFYTGIVWGIFLKCYKALRHNHRIHS